MQSSVHYKKAFSLLELIFVIIILGIVSSIGATILAQLYENHIVQRAMHRVTSKTELAINQIANRLSYRINNSVITRRTGTFAPLTDMIFNTTNRDRTTLEWIGYDNESFSAQRTPGWSGYCDLSASSAAGGISTPGSNLRGISEDILKNLSDSTAVPPLALLFSLNGNLDAGIVPSSQCFGYDGNTSCIHQVTITNNTTLGTNRAAATAHISDHYKLAWSAFAIVSVNEDALYNDVRDGAEVSGENPRSFDLEFRYNYQPWAGDSYDDAGTARSTIIRNVTSFKYAELGGTLRIKLCATERVGDVGSSVNVSVCKEKVVMR